VKAAAGDDNKGSQLKVPGLNLSTLKHVKEYTSQSTVTLDNKMEGLEIKPMEAKAAKPDPANDTDNQWYHYSTKLELNVKILRKQIEDLESKLSNVQNQLSIEV